MHTHISCISLNMVQAMTYACVYHQKALTCLFPSLKIQLCSANEQLESVGPSSVLDRRWNCITGKAKAWFGINCGKQTWETESICTFVNRLESVVAALVYSHRDSLSIIWYVYISSSCVSSWLETINVFIYLPCCVSHSYLIFY